MADTLFRPGHSGGPGRPRGSRNKLAETFFDALYADFQEHGVSALAAAREESPVAYLKVIASVLPQKIEVNRVTTQMSDEELLAIIRAGAGAGTKERADDEPLH